MDTPRQAPREIKSTILRVAKLTIGAAALATIAAVAAKCNSCVENFHDDAGTASDVLNGNNATEPDEDAEKNVDANATQEPKPDVVTPATDGGKETDAQALDKHRLLNEKMNALTDAFAKRYPFMPEPTGEDGHYTCDDQEKIQSPINLLREAVWVGPSDRPRYTGDQILHIMDGVQGCNAAGQLFSLIYRYESGKLWLSISSLRDLREGGLGVPASENDIPIAVGYINIVEEYLRKREYLKKMNREFWDNDNENRRHYPSSERDFFRSRTGYDTKDEAECRLKETYRAKLTVYSNNWMPPAQDEWTIEDRKRGEVDNGDLFCGKKNEE